MRREYQSGHECPLRPGHRLAPVQAMQKRAHKQCAQHPERNGVRQSAMNAQRSDVRDKRVEQHIEVGQCAERCAPIQRLIADAVAQRCLTDSGPQCKLCERIHSVCSVHIGYNDVAARMYGVPRKRTPSSTVYAVTSP